MAQARMSNRPLRSAQGILRVRGIVNTGQNAGKTAEFRVSREMASLGNRSDYQRVERYTWEVIITEDDGKLRFYRGKATGRNIAALARDIRENLRAIDPTEPSFIDQAAMARLGL